MYDELSIGFSKKTTKILINTISIDKFNYLKIFCLRLYLYTDRSEYEENIGGESGIDIILCIIQVDLNREWQDGVVYNSIITYFQYFTYVRNYKYFLQ